MVIMAIIVRRITHQRQQLIVTNHHYTGIRDVWYGMVQQLECFIYFFLITQWSFYYEVKASFQVQPKLKFSLDYAIVPKHWFNK